MGVVAALNHVVRPKEICNLRSPTPLWQEPGNKKGERRDAVPSWRSLSCLPTARRQRNCSGWYDGTEGCFVPTASIRTSSNTASTRKTCSGTPARTAARHSTTRPAPSLHYKHVSIGNWMLALWLFLCGPAQRRLDKVHLSGDWTGLQDRLLYDARHYGTDTQPAGEAAEGNMRDRRGIRQGRLQRGGAGHQRRGPHRSQPPRPSPRARPQHVRKEHANVHHILSAGHRRRSRILR